MNLTVFGVFIGLVVLIVSLRFFRSVSLALILSIFSISIITNTYRNILHYFFKTAVYPQTWETILVIYGIYVIMEVMRETKDSDRFSKAMISFFPYKQSIALIPFSIGILPMPGGAMFTAPMVKEIAEKERMKPLDAVAINYWFRHSAEFSWILYPAVILESSIIGIKLQKVFLLQLPITVLALIGGWITFKLPRFYINRKGDLRDLFFYSLPILIIIIGVMIGVKGFVIVPLVSIIYASIKNKFVSFVRAFKLDIFAIIYLTFFYKFYLSESGILKDFVNGLESVSISPWIIITFTPLILGIMTGITYASFSITIPITDFFVKSGYLPFSAYFLNYYFSVTGVLLSPVHLCLLLTSQFFDQKMSDVLKRLILPFSFSALGMFITFIITGGAKS